MQNRCESGIVIGWELANSSGLFRFRVGLGVGTADEPEDRRRTPLNTERPKVLAGGSGISLPNAIGGKM